MAKQANINAGPKHRALRSIGRCERLKQSIEKAKQRGNAERVESLQAEYVRRIDEIRDLKETLEAALDG